MSNNQEGNVQLWGTILLVIGHLLLSNTREIPEDDSSVVGAASKDAGLLRVPRERCDCVVVSFQRVDLLLNVSKIPDTEGLIRRRCCDEHFRRGVESKSVDGIQVAALSNHCSAIRLGLAHVNDLHGQIIRDGSDEALGDRVVLDIINDLGVVCVLSGGFERVASTLESLQVPVEKSH